MAIEEMRLNNSLTPFLVHPSPHKKGIKDYVAPISDKQHKLF
jgi:hypothetical protein